MCFEIRIFTYKKSHIYMRIHKIPQIKGEKETTNKEKGILKKAPEVTLWGFRFVYTWYYILLADAIITYAPS